MSKGDLKLHCRDVVAKTARYCIKIDMNGIEDTETSPHCYSHLILNKGTKNIYWRKDRLFNKWVLGKLDICMWKNEFRSLSFTLHQSQIKKYHRLRN